MPIKFEPIEQRADGQRGSGIIKSYGETALDKTLDLLEYIDDTRRDEIPSSVIGWMIHQQVIASAEGNELAESIAAGAIQYMKKVFSELAEISSHYAQIERKHRKG